MTAKPTKYEETEKFLQGLEIRRDVLGEEKINRSLWGADTFNQPMQQLVTEYCWGAVWGRPGLPRKFRSLLNIGLLTALNRQRELELHIRAAFDNGCTTEEIQEVLLQTAVYAGVPAGIEGFRVATPIVEEMQSRDAGEKR